VIFYPIKGFALLFVMVFVLPLFFLRNHLIE